MGACWDKDEKISTINTQCYLDGESEKISTKNTSLHGGINLHANQKFDKYSTQTSLIT